MTTNENERSHCGDGRIELAFLIVVILLIPISPKAERNQNMPNAFYQGGHSQTDIASAFALSSSTVSRVVTEYETENEK